MPNIDAHQFERPDTADFAAVGASSHPPRILLLYGSLRERSLSKLLTLEAQRLLIAMGAETKVYDPTDL
jgi:arsenic resistance protein ArsH